MIDRVVAAAEAAGRAIQAIAVRGFEVQHKGAQGPVTEADHASDALLHESLLAIEDCAWLSEETFDDRSRLNHDRLWIVDPLDGTKEFVQGIPEYAVAIALVDRGRAVLGVVHNPMTDETFWAEQGTGAFQHGGPIAVSEGNTILASRSEMKRGEFAPFDDLWDVVHLGSIQYKLGRVAAGHGAATLSQGPKWEWDVCAGGLIVEEAGGVATDVFGTPLAYNGDFPKTKGVLAGAPATYQRVLNTVRAVGPSQRMRREFSDV